MLENANKRQRFEACLHLGATKCSLTQIRLLIFCILFRILCALCFPVRLCSAGGPFLQFRNAAADAVALWWCAHTLPRRFDLPLQIHVAHRQRHPGLWGERERNGYFYERFLLSKIHIYSSSVTQAIKRPTVWHEFERRKENILSSQCLFPLVSAVSQ